MADYSEHDEKEVEIDSKLNRISVQHTRINKYTKRIGFLIGSAALILSFYDVAGTLKESGRNPFYEKSAVVIEQIDHSKKTLSRLEDLSKYFGEAVKKRYFFGSAPKKH